VERGPTGTTSTAVPSTEASSEQHVDGTWGEHDVGGPVSHRMAMDDYEKMRKQLSNLSQTRSRDSGRAERQRIFRSTTDRTQRSVLRNAGRTRTRSSTNHGLSDEDLEAGDAKSVAEKEEEFELGPFIQEGRFEKRTETGESTKKVGVVFKNLTVKGAGSTKNYVRTLPNAILGTFGPDLYHIICNYIPALKLGGPPPVRALVNGFTGLVRDGEMMLVLGRPGSGCSTFLKAIANQRGGFAKVSGNVKYGGIPADKQHAHYRGEVNYNPEDDQHFPALNVWQTLKFSLLNKTKRRESGEIDVIIRALLRMFGISHTSKTLVGNEYVRGISGGERKRVSIAETLATKSTVVCWYVYACSLSTGSELNLLGITQPEDLMQAQP
jgi:ATP-binding cassette subfamily G (WHITE) protein 2 (SNQ2)